MNKKTKKSLKRVLRRAKKMAPFVAVGVTSAVGLYAARRNVTFAVAKVRGALGRATDLRSRASDESVVHA